MLRFQLLDNCVIIGPMATPKSTFLPASADALARLYTAEATGFMVQCMRGEIPGIKPSERLKAAQTILERGHGRSVQAVIAIPQRQANTKKLAGLDDAALLAIAKGGSTGPERGPQAGGNSAGTIQDEFVDLQAKGQGLQGGGGMASAGGGSTASAEVPSPRASVESLSSQELERMGGMASKGVPNPRASSKWDTVAVDAEIADSYDPTE